MIDLSFELGIPEEELARRITNRSFVLYQQYAAKRMLPMRRMELLLAQTSLITAQAVGGAKELTLSDFLFDPTSDSSEEASAEDARAFFGFNPPNRE